MSVSKIEIFLDDNRVLLQTANENFETRNYRGEVYVFENDILDETEDPKRGVADKKRKASSMDWLGMSKSWRTFENDFSVENNHTQRNPKNLKKLYERSSNQIKIILSQKREFRLKRIQMLIVISMKQKKIIF